MDVSVTTWLITIGAMVLVLGFDVFVIGRRPHEPSMKEAGLLIGVFVALAALFGIGVGLFSGGRYAGEFFAGWLTEYSLSVDNLFIFVIILTKLKVPRQFQQYALMVGILLALVFRGVFIGLGAGLIELFSWIFFIFGAFLIYTAIKLFVDYRKDDHDDAVPDNPVMRFAKRRLPSTEEFHGTKLTVRLSGRRLITPMLFVIIALGSTDLLFALDSIPAIYGLTREPYLVFTANVFALMGLRQLYFLIGGLLKRLVYLSLGLSVILAFIGVKLVLHAMHEYHLDERLNIPFSLDVPIWLSLTVIVATLAVTTVASLIKSSREQSGAVPSDAH
ncbi:tellurium resistance protein TerC [Microlunatus endophyticus]|uniref:Tellurium resistance protein TerC n=1 Tax=Microlunatus endophyticus TaxID=1716077 RepID=A0A917SEG4_9ACTN|nr:TerC family protein [Microlunatus endophyticus]GGL76402.1 tellurium resistance protein TerC [Microlunatus endophyticus]